MPEKIEPIYDFESLKKFLTEKGFVVESAQGYREIRPEEVTIDSINKGEIEFSEEGIFVVLPNGEKQQAFLYKRDYHLEKYGKPRYHDRKCQVIEKFISRNLFNDCYVKANSYPVPVRNLDDNNREEMIEKLPHCMYCAFLGRATNDVDSNEFVDLLRKARKANMTAEVKEVDIFGYTKDWETISREYRQKHNYTCEQCGLSIDDAFDRQFIHVHHIDENKLNNRESNLKCLCMGCHAEVDEYHRNNLKTGANRIIYDAFVEKYKR